MASANHKRKAQSRLSFEPLPSSSPVAKEYHPQIQDRAAAVRYDRIGPSPTKRRRVATTEHSLPTPEPSARQWSQSPGKKVNEVAPQASGHRGNNLKKRAKQGRLDFGAAISSATAGDTALSDERAYSATPHSPTQPIALSSESSSDSDELPRSSRKKRQTQDTGSFMSFRSQRSTARNSVNQSNDSPTVQHHSDNVDATSALLLDQSSGEDEDDDNEDDMPTTLGIRRRKKPPIRNSQPSSSPPIAFSSDDDEVVVVRSGKRRDRKPTSDNSDQSDDDNDSNHSTKPRGSRRLKRRTQLTEQEQQDLDSDLEFLGNTSDVERAPRSTQNTQKTARLRALEMLRQKRSGQTVPTPEGQHDREDDEPDIVRDLDDSDRSTQSDEDLDEYDTRTAIPTSSSRAMFQADEDDEDFLDDDEDAEEGILGVPEGIPLEFTGFASKKAKDLFKYAIEWMVQKKINPAFRAEDEIYDLAFKKLNDEVEGLVRSKFKSSAWIAGFVQSLNSRPDIDIRPMAGGLSSVLTADHCDACNRTGHPASYEVQFLGKPYHPTTLDAVEQCADDDDDDEDDADDSASDRHNLSDDLPAVDYKGSKVPPAAKVYYVGRFCMANAETAHELQHWKIHLYEWVVKELHRTGHYEASKVVERDSWSTKKRRKHANKIVDRMENEGVIKKLWREFSDTIARARESKQGRW